MNKKFVYQVGNNKKEKLEIGAYSEFLIAGWGLGGGLTPGLHIINVSFLKLYCTIYFRNMATCSTKLSPNLNHKCFLVFLNHLRLFNFLYLIFQNSYKLVVSKVAGSIPDGITGIFH